MTYRVRRHVEVEEDIINLAMWIGRDSHDAAIRFLMSVEETIADLRYMPGNGSPKRLRLKRAGDVRSWSVRGFPNHLILYELRRREVRVLTVVDGSRRYQRLVRERLQDQ